MKIVQNFGKKVTSLKQLSEEQREQIINQWLDGLEEGELVVSWSDALNDNLEQMDQDDDIFNEEFDELNV